MDKPAQPVNPLEFRQAMRNWTTGVTIVTVSYQGIQHGMTVSSFASISLTPATVLISLERDARTHDLLIESGNFGVTILTAGQQALSERFAGEQTELENRFEGLKTFTLISGVPFLEGGLAFFDCCVIKTHGLTTNTLFLGEVMAVQEGAPGPPLLYSNRQYRRLQD
ncbi:MAG TPA: flavin reductase family protein [Anaerolineales bacterium]